MLILIHFISLLKDCLQYITAESFPGEGLMTAHPEHAKDISSLNAQTCREKTNRTRAAEEQCVFSDSTEAKALWDIDSAL